MKTKISATIYKTAQRCLQVGKNEFLVCYTKET